MAATAPARPSTTSIALATATARLLAWLGGVENTHLCGQAIYVDGGSDAVIRGDSVW